MTEPTTRSLHSLAAIQSAFAAKYPSAQFHETTGECVAQLAEAWRMFKEGWLSCHDTLNQEPVSLPQERVRRLYIAGPMTGYADYNFPAFNALADAMRQAGWHVENPADHGLVPGANWADYLRYDIRRLATCEAIMLLPGWSKSDGAKLEVHIAECLGASVMLSPGAESVPEQASIQFEGREQAIKVLIAEIRAAKTLARRDSIFEQLIGLLEMSSRSEVGCGAPRKAPAPIANAIKLLENIAVYGALAGNYGRPTPISDQCKRVALELRAAALAPTQASAQLSHWVAVPRLIPKSILEKTGWVIGRELNVGGTELKIQRVLREVFVTLRAEMLAQAEEQALAGEELPQNNKMEQ